MNKLLVVTKIQKLRILNEISNFKFIHMLDITPITQKLTAKLKLKLW